MQIHSERRTRHDNNIKSVENGLGPFGNVNVDGWGSTASRLEPLRGGSLLFTIKFPEIPGTHFVDLRRTKG